MNTKPILDLADKLEQPWPENRPGFDMEYFVGGFIDDEGDLLHVSKYDLANRPGHPCGTVCCIAGHLWLDHSPENMADYAAAFEIDDEREQDEAFDLIDARTTREVHDILGVAPVPLLSSFASLASPNNPLSLLFFPQDWPSLPRDQYRQARTEEERRKVTAKYMRAFVAAYESLNEYDHNVLFEAIKSACEQVEW